jgi:N-acetylglucosaminyl-diphospho-decaprenol L-rhamnosyltransferase
MDLSIIVVSFNTRELLRACLDSIHAATTGRRCETIVVDNASSDGSAEMVAMSFPGVALIRNERNLGFAAANNQAMAVSRGRYLLLLNSDAVLLPTTLPALLTFMEQHPRCGLAGAQLLNPDGSFQASYADFPTLVGELLLMTTLARLFRPPTFPSYPAEESQVTREVDWVFGACMVVRRAAVEAIGGLDEDYFMYSEETDWCYRLRQAGWSVGYVPSARVIHWSGQSASRVPERKRSQLYRGKWLFMRKHYAPLVAPTFRLAVLAGTALKCVIAHALILTSRGPRRQLARQHLRSHQLLLAEL